MTNRKLQFKNSSRGPKIQECWPAPEDVSCYAYAITISPDPSSVFYPTDHTKSSMTEFGSFVKQRLIKLCACKLLLYLEFSKTGRWHFHGFIDIDINHLCFFYLHDLPILQEDCNIELKRCNDPFNWHLYCIKNSETIIREMPYVQIEYDSEYEMERHVERTIGEADDLTTFVRLSNNL